MTAADDALPQGSIEERVIDALRGVFDPEIPVNVYELGLIYDIAVGPENDVAITMTLTAPNCPAAGAIPADIESKVRLVEGVRDVKVELVFEPPWTKDRMSEAARLELGFM